MTRETWRDIQGFECFYAVSDLGRIKNVRTGHILTPSAAGEGYHKVALCRDGKQARRYVHAIVLETFVGRRPPMMEAAHGNGRRDDNRLANLRWATRAANHADKIIHGTISRGETHGRRKLSAAQAKEIRSATGTYKAIGHRFGVGAMQVHRIKTGKNWSSAK